MFITVRQSIVFVFILHHRVTYIDCFVFVVFFFFFSRIRRVQYWLQWYT